MFNSLLISIVLLSPLGGAQSAGTSSPTTRLEVEVVYIGPGGFFPSHIKRPHGKFRLLVLDHSGLSSLKPHVVGPSGKTLVQFGIDITQRSYQRINDIDVSPGSFHLKEDSHPGWDLTIEIEP